MVVLNGLRKRSISSKVTMNKQRLNFIDRTRLTELENNLCRFFLYRKIWKDCFNSTNYLFSVGKIKREVRLSSYGTILYMGIKEVTNYFYRFWFIHMYRDPAIVTGCSIGTFRDTYPEIPFSVKNPRNICNSFFFSHPPII